MGLVGESGSDKSITSLVIIGLLDKKAKITGSAKFEGQELVGAPESVFEKLRGAVISMIYQDALSSLNPSMLIKDQMEQLTKRDGRKTPEELLRLVKLDPHPTRMSSLAVSGNAYLLQWRYRARPSWSLQMSQPRHWM